MTDKKEYMDKIATCPNIDEKDKVEQYAINIARSMAEAFAKQKEVKEKKEEAQMAISIIDLRLDKDIKRVGNEK